MLEPAIISVHTPKCAGASVRRGLQAVFGERAHLDYDDQIADPASPYNIDPARFWSQTGRYAELVRDKALVHGHFHPAKYDEVQGAVFITYMREPLERALSHYFFWRSAAPQRPHTVWRYMLEADLDFEAFCRLPDINRLYSDRYFSGFDVDRFELVGFSDRLEAFTAAMKERFGADITPGRENVTRDPAYAEARARYLDDPAMRARLIDHFKDDLAIYDRLRTRFC